MNNFTPKERREIAADMANRHNNSLHGRTRVDDLAGGGFSVTGRPQIIGASADAAYPRLPFSRWENDPPEALIDASDTGLTYIGEPMGTMQEIEAAKQILESRAPPPSSDPSVAGEPPTTVDPSPVDPVVGGTFRRRSL